MRHRHHVMAIVVGIWALTALLRPEIPAAGAPLACNSDFEGGSGVVESIDQEARAIRITPTVHKDRGWVCWWYVRVSGMRPGETITLEVASKFGAWAKPQRAAFSTDNRTWVHTAPGKREKERIVYRQKVDAPVAWFAWGPRFVPSDAENLLAETARKCPYAEKFELCRTREGRPVPALRVCQPGDGKGDRANLPGHRPDVGRGPKGASHKLAPSPFPPDDAARYGVWINARQHAWETGSSWVSRGLIEWLVSDDPRAETLRKKSLVVVVPIMDVDNTFRGAGGKRQKPHDHNRDWCKEPHWPSVAAAIERIKGLDEQGRFDLYLDLHNPSPGDRQPFFFTAPKDLLKEPGRANQERFLAAARTEITGPLKLATRRIESGPKYDPLWKQISNTWVAAHTRPHVVALCLETSWDTPHSTTEGYLAVGRQLGLAVERYFRENPRAVVQAKQ